MLFHKYVKIASPNSKPQGIKMNLGGGPYVKKELHTQDTVTPLNIPFPLGKALSNDNQEHIDLQIESYVPVQ